MAIEHDSIADGERHEPKGIAGAATGEVYVADGVGAGAWTSGNAVGTVILTAVIADVSTAEVVYVPIMHAGTITKITTVLGGAIITSDATITPKDSAGLSMGAITVAQAGSAAGDVDTVSPSSNNAVSADDYITIETDGLSGNVVPLWVAIELTRS